MLLLVGSLLLTSSFARLSRVDVGFETRNVLTVPLDLPERAYPEDRRYAFFDQALTRVAGAARRRVRRGDSDRSVPAVGLCQRRDAGGARRRRAAERVHAGRVAQRDAGILRHAARADDQRAQLHERGPRRCAARGDRLAESAPEACGRVQNAVGHRIYWGGVGGRTRTVVGVVGDIRDVTIDADPTPMLYLPYGQLPLNGMTLIVRTRGDVPGTAGELRREIRGARSGAAGAGRPGRSRRTGWRRFRHRGFAWCCSGCSARPRCSSRRSGSTASCRSRSPSGRARSRFAWRSARGRRRSSASSSGAVFASRSSAALVGLIVAWQLSTVLRSLLFQTDVHELQLFAFAAIVLVGRGARGQLPAGPARRAPRPSGGAQPRTAVAVTRDRRRQPRDAAWPTRVRSGPGSDLS